MKGIVFTEFLELVETKFGLEMVDTILSQSDLESNGIYTAIGTYEFSEMLQLLTNLSKNTDIPPDTLLTVYGEHFFSVLERDYPDLIARFDSPIELLSSIENHIHVEVRKIYPDAELPTFMVKEKSDHHLIVLYKSSRALSALGLGLMNKTLEHYKTEGEIVIEKINDSGTEVNFIINIPNG